MTYTFISLFTQVYIVVLPLYYMYHLIAARQIAPYIYLSHPCSCDVRSRLWHQPSVGRVYNIWGLRWWISHYGLLVVWHKAHWASRYVSIIGEHTYFRLTNQARNEAITHYSTFYFCTPNTIHKMLNTETCFYNVNFQHIFYQFIIKKTQQKTPARASYITLYITFMLCTVHDVSHQSVAGILMPDAARPSIIAFCHTRLRLTNWVILIWLCICVYMDPLLLTH